MTGQAPTRYAPCAKGCGGFLEVSDQLVALGWRPGDPVSHAACPGSVGEADRSYRVDVLVLREHEDCTAAGCELSLDVQPGEAERLPHDRHLHQLRTEVLVRVSGRGRGRTVADAAGQLWADAEAAWTTKVLPNLHSAEDESAGAADPA